MAKDGSTKAKSPEQRRDARAAAKARKRRNGNGQASKREDGYVPLGFVAVKAQADYKRREANRIESKQFNAHVDSESARFIKQIDQFGAASISRSLEGYRDIIRNVKNRFNNTDVLWHENETATVFARKR